jgi:hypothetical protein
MNLYFYTLLQNKIKLLKKEKVLWAYHRFTKKCSINKMFFIEEFKLCSGIKYDTHIKLKNETLMAFEIVLITINF